MNFHSRFSFRKEQEKRDFIWKDGGGTERHRVDMEKISLQNSLWISSYHKEGKKACLNEADLSGADLSNMSLDGACLVDIKSSSPLSMVEAHLDEATLSYAHLEGALGVGASLRGAYLDNAFLNEAKLDYAALDRADLKGANLNHAELKGAHLSGAIYEPKGQPVVASIAYAEGLDQLRYDTDPTPLFELRRSFQGAGFVRQARLITAALRRHQEHWLERICFDWTCDWGADWRHPLVLLGWLCLVCGPVYWVGMHFGRVGGIYQIVLDTTVVTKASKELVTRVETGVRWGGRPALRTRTFGQRERRVPTQIPYGNNKKERQEPKQEAKAGLLFLRKRMRRPGSGRGWVGPVLRTEWRALRLAFLFSVLSALDIGFHEFNVGVWARMVLARDFNLKARGWMRVAGGVQSLVGLGLVALSLLSYFGHPFD